MGGAQTLLLGVFWGEGSGQGEERARKKLGEGARKQPPNPNPGEVNRALLGKHHRETRLLTRELWGG